MDNWLTSIPLPDQLLKIPMNSPVVGNIQKNKREILSERLELRSRSVGNSMIYLEQAKTLLSYKTKQNQTNVLFFYVRSMKIRI
ncbi:hypothetical protein TNCT_527061 [Trichonephila clavata]|uniref:Uncharacterized protein n=1 Tax=Trichonephila clavata TaxID=2740835 RepID=A0A8X6H5G7_TRICU|nr:hypothetical protein TNCT_527061 [Trichonephila clavata]